MSAWAGAAGGLTKEMGLGGLAGGVCAQERGERGEKGTSGGRQGTGTGKEEGTTVPRARLRDCRAVKGQISVHSQKATR